MTTARTSKALAGSSGPILSALAGSLISDVAPLVRAAR